MSDYTPTTNFTAKDSLPTGNPSKVVSGVDFDLEFTNIQTAVATKVDAVGSGLALASKTISYDIASLTNVTPAAGDEFVITDVSDSGNPKAVLFSALEAALSLANLSDYTGTLIEDIHGLADPNADRIMFWDDTAGSVAFLTASTGLTLSGTSLTTNDSAIAHYNLSGFVANEHINHSSVSITAGNGLSGGGTIAATRTLNLDISGLTNGDITDFGQNDSILFNDAGTMKQMDREDMGIPLVTTSLSQTFAASDLNTAQILTGSTGRTFTVPSGLGVNGSMIIVGSRDTAVLTIAGSGVTITSANSLTDVSPGGMALLYRVASTEWMLAGALQ